MIDSLILNENNLKIFEKNLLEKLNTDSDFENKRIVSSSRAVGDAVQEIIAEELPKCFPEGLIKNFNDSFARRAMADVAFCDLSDNYFIVDIKTHNRNTDFNMPNLTSVERLSRFYEDDKNFFVVLLVEYKVQEKKIIFDRARFIPIENLEWNCLTIGALGWGQIQIANANIIKVNSESTRKEWMLNLCDIMDIFYPKEISKIEKRMDKFQKIREFWETK